MAQPHVSNGICVPRVQRIICGSLRKVQQKQGSPTDLDILMALEVATAAWAATPLVVSFWEYTSAASRKLVSIAANRHCVRVWNCQTWICTKESHSQLISFGDVRYDHFGTWHRMCRCLLWYCSMSSVELCKILQRGSYLQTRSTEDTAPWQCRHCWPMHGEHFVLLACLPVLYFRARLAK